MDKIAENDWILIHTPRKKVVVKVEKGKSISLPAGNLKLEELIDKEYGSIFNRYYLLKPTLDDVILYGLKRKTQIIYPKEAGSIVFKLNLNRGMKVFESGTGSGALSIIISRFIAPDGILHTYEREKGFYLNAKENIEHFGNSDNVKMYNQDIEQGILEKDFDAAFLDFKGSFQYIELMKNILKPGGILGLIVPTTNQIIEALHPLNRFFTDIEVIEMSVRKYKNVPERLRPEDIMVGHTGYLIFAR